MVSFCISGLALPSCRPAAAQARSPYQQPADQFAAAINNRSTSPSFVLVTVIDARSGEAHLTCLGAPALIAGLRAELNAAGHTGSVAEAREVALSRADHAYRIADPRALAGLLAYDRNRSDAACAIIRAGRPAFMSDRTGAVREGQP